MRGRAIWLAFVLSSLSSLSALAALAGSVASCGSRTGLFGDDPGSGGGSSGGAGPEGGGEGSLQDATIDVPLIDAARLDALRQLARGADGLLVDAGHRADRARRIERGVEEHRVNEISRVQRGLADEGPERGGSS